MPGAWILGLASSLLREQPTSKHAHGLRIQLLQQTGEADAQLGIYPSLKQ